MPAKADLVGERFGKLVGVRATPRRINGGVVWECLCDCGRISFAKASWLRSGNTKSCGCGEVESRAARCVTHGKSKLPIYAMWQGMIDRCTNPNNKRYDRYGARGITVCDAWKDFAQFYADMGDCPKDKSLDRIDNDKGYDKNNCRWATCKEQAANTSRSRRVTIGGITDIMGNWKRELNKGYYTVLRMEDAKC